MRLSGAAPAKTIRLIAPVEIKGQVTLPQGGAAGNVLVLARRINAVEAASKSEYAVPGIDQLIAQTRSNANGKYVLSGLRPGNYWVWVYPEKRLTRDFVGQTFQQTFLAPSNTQNFALWRGALVQGVVLSQTNKQPVRGQTMWLFDSQENNQYTITDARGFFKFRTLGGKQRLRVHANGENSPPPGFILPAKSQFDFEIQNGQKREFKIELPGAPVIKPTTGTVVGPDGKPVANARVIYQNIGTRGGFGRGGFGPRLTRAGADGRFVLPGKDGGPVQLFASSGEFSTAHSTIALSGEDVKLLLKANVWASVEGRVVDERKQPVAGAVVRLDPLVGYMGMTGESVTSDDKGNFRFARLQPGAGAWVDVTKRGFLRAIKIIDNLNVGKKYRLDVRVESTPANLTGIVFNTDGTPASGFQVRADGVGANTRTRADGRFFLAGVRNGAVSVCVYPPNSNQGWEPVLARGGDKHLVIRLNQVKRQLRDFSRPVRPQPNFDSLVGTFAPEIQSVYWANGKAAPLASLHGEVVLLTFDNFDPDKASMVSDVARSPGNRIRVVGVQFNFPHSPLSPHFKRRMDNVGSRMPFPIALDAPPSTPHTLGGQTFALYKNATFVVIGLDGRIVYAGGELLRAIALAATASQ